MEKENCTEELQQLSPFLAQLHAKAQATVPTPPMQYFDNLDSKILEKIDQEGNTAKNSLPAELKNWQPTAPSGYFEGLTDQILAKAKPQTTPKTLVAQQRHSLKVVGGAWWAAAASVALLLAFAGYFWQSKTFDNQVVIKNNDNQTIDNQKIVTTATNHIIENLPDKRELKNKAESPVKTTPNAAMMPPSSTKIIDLPSPTTSAKVAETFAAESQTAYRNGRNDLEILNKNLEKILLEANTEGGELLDLFHFSDEDLDLAIGGGR